MPFLYFQVYINKQETIFMFTKKFKFPKITSEEPNRWAWWQWEIRSEIAPMYRVLEDKDDRQRWLRTRLDWGRSASICQTVPAVWEIDGSPPLLCAPPADGPGA